MARPAWLLACRLTPLGQRRAESQADVCNHSEGRIVACEPPGRDRDRYGRTVALCRADGRDLGQAMVAADTALAFTRSSTLRRRPRLRRRA
jgi:endonuclease YncB( thermonuclease family)